jgi:hypothetical protein
MAESSDGVVVTEGMLISAARAGDLKSLTIWARQGVHVTSGEPLCHAARGGHIEAMRCLVQQLGADVSKIYNGVTPLMTATQWDNLAVLQCLVELGADVNQAASTDGCTPLIMAAIEGNLASVRCLIKLGAHIGAVDDDGDTALLVSARNGHYSAMRYLLEGAGANMDDVNDYKQTVWVALIVHLDEEAAKYGMEEDPLALAGLLRVLVLRGAPPPVLVALLSPEPARVVQEGARLRARLPAYLVRRRALLDAHCPVLLPPLRALVHGYMELTTTEELWATGLGTAP